MKKLLVTLAACAAAVGLILVSHIQIAYGALGGWSVTFEGIPADSENISLGANRIRVFKQEVRVRGDVEHDWGTISGGNSDTARHREGSAVAFAADADPTAMNDPASTTLSDANGSDGRLFVDTNAGNIIHVWDGAGADTWETTNQVTIDFAQKTDTQTIAAATGSFATVLTTGGGADLTATVTAPADASHLKITATAKVVARTTNVGCGSCFGTHFVCKLMEDGVEVDSAMYGDTSATPGIFPHGDTLILEYVNESLTNSNAYDYTVDCDTNSAAGTGLDVIINSTPSGAPSSTLTSWVKARMEPAL